MAFTHLIFGVSVWCPDPRLMIMLKKMQNNNITRQILTKYSLLVYLRDAAGLTLSFISSKTIGESR